MDNKNYKPVPRYHAVPTHQCCGVGMFIPDLNFFNPGFRSQGKKDSGSRIRIRIKVFKVCQHK
jgi:hypothetical protein